MRAEVSISVIRVSSQYVEQRHFLHATSSLRPRVDIHGSDLGTMLHVQMRSSDSPAPLGWGAGQCEQ